MSDYLDYLTAKNISILSKAIYCFDVPNNEWKGGSNQGVSCNAISS